MYWFKNGAELENFKESIMISKQTFHMKLLNLLQFRSKK